jgi:outer membrane protein OmpA-like peptidoglycan-associated protein
MLSHYLKICTRSGLAAAAVALMLTFLPTDGTAQQQTRRVILTDLPIAEQMEIATLAEATGDEADELLTRARTAQETTKYRKAGELFERSAQLRTPGDRRATEGFEAAGAAYFNADKPARASRAWEEAANLALIRGDVYAASENYMRAALAAHENGDQFRVSDMGWKAYYLTESSRLSKDQKKQLGRYIAVQPVSLEEAQTEHRAVLPYMQLISMHMVHSAEVERLQAVETQYRALRDSLAGSSSRNPYASERITMAETIHFAHDRSDLSGEARAILRDKVPVFRAHPSMRITVTGYASQRGARAYNEALGLRRADAARAYLVSQGVAESRIDIATRGEDNLSVAGPSEAADAANRRGVFTILMAERRISQN